MKVGIIGGGHGGLAVLNLLLSIPEVEVMWVADLDDGAPAMIRAREAGVHETNDFIPLLDAEDLHMVIEVTGLDRVKELIYANKPDHVLVMEAEEAKLLITIVKHKEETSRKLVENAEKLAGYIEEINLSAQLIRERMKQLAKEAEALARRGEELTKTSQTAAAEAEKTQEILHFVEEITKTSKIIGINAAIEASRVGKEGQGFAVVAAEISRLAEDSGSSNKEIAKITRSIVQSMENIHTGIAQSKDVARSQVEAAEEVLTTLETLADVSLQLRELANNLLSM
ncbi:MAG: hypothetical protein GX357_08245 [Firmicutes bacterium]|nr:hypothetical protein [Bacillota bacterium]